jgi:hypothetical protein
MRKKLKEIYKYLKESEIEETALSIFAITIIFTAFILFWIMTGD